MTDTSVGQVVTTEEVADLPLNGCTPMQLALLSAGVISTIQPGQLLPFANGTAASLAIGGIASNSSELLLDGAPDDIWTGVLAYSPPQDSVQQVTVKVFDADASYGHTMSGVINQVLKSGGNKFHGTAYEYSQASALDANRFFNNRTDTPIVVTHYNQYGASQTGPVLLPRLYDGHNKLFFLFAWEALKLKKPATSYSTVPTDAERTGDFSALLPLGCPNGYLNGNTAVCANGKANAYQLYNPYKATLSGTTITRQPLTNNSITASGIQLNPITLAYLKFFPEPNTTPSAPTGYHINLRCCECQSVCTCGEILMQPGGGVRLAASGVSAKQRMQCGIKLSDTRSQIIIAVGKLKDVTDYAVHQGKRTLNAICIEG